ncbi:hypothetical protein H632_c3221p0 [Helicosporidium sp. ATCC 50920]|nr:hypothetical protein H632_c3221p0 [Helicosporidium sp. ATCC 50920]|eukprot:KDD72534.1 hypothetical protein H632_c3221p0 [Helicosporidium sp. ATCC 50920]
MRAAQIYDARARERERPGEAPAKARPDGRGGVFLPEESSQEPPLPRLALLITGKGPLRARYEREMAALDLEHVALRTLWLEPGDYPVLLGSADVGVSLHASSSGLDLPMKVVDAQGCGLPVCALRYPCLERELVREGLDGLLFETAEGLAESLVELGESVGQPQGLLHCLRAGARDGSKETWQQAWDRAALPLL